MIVADANVYLAVILNEPEKQAIIESTRGVGLISPEVLTKLEMPWLPC